MNETERSGPPPAISLADASDAGPQRRSFGRATRAYATSSGHRSARMQEADVFRRANSALRHGQTTGTMPYVRALADNNLLWTTVMALMHDPKNGLPDKLRGLIVSVGLAVQREMQNPAPDFGFLMTVNEDIAAGLTQTGH